MVYPVPGAHVAQIKPSLTERWRLAEVRKP